MKKLVIAALASCMTTVALADTTPIETRDYTQPPVITTEFVVKQGDQAMYADMKKDTDEIQLESDNFGLKTLQREMSFAKVKERFDSERRKLADEWNHLQRFPDPKEHN